MSDSACSTPPGTPSEQASSASTRLLILPYCSGPPPPPLLTELAAAWSSLWVRKMWFKQCTQLGTARATMLQSRLPLMQCDTKT